MRRLRVAVRFAGLALILIVAAANADSSRAQLSTSRVFDLGAGKVTRSFTLRERSGVILLNRVTAPGGLRVMIEAELRAPALNGLGKVVAGARVTTWQLGNDPSLSCRHDGTSQVCTQGEEWCPMPAATWHFRLVKLGGASGTIRFDYVVAPPPGTYRWHPVGWASVLLN